MAERRELRKAVQTAAAARDRFIRANLRLVVSIAAALPASPHAGTARPDPGGQPRPRARGREVRLAGAASSSPPTRRSGSASPSDARWIRRAASSACRRIAPRRCVLRFATTAATATRSTTRTPGCSGSAPRPRWTRRSAMTATARSSTSSAMMRRGRSISPSKRTDAAW